MKQLLENSFETLHEQQLYHIDAVIKKHRARLQPETRTYHGYNFTLSPTVYSPFIAPSGNITFMFAGLPIFEGKTVLDIGCGSGIVMFFAALSGARKVVGVDINPDAVQDTRRNTARVKEKAEIEIYEGDVFDPLPPQEKFDIVFANLPFTSGSPKDLLESAFFDNELSAIHRFIELLSLRLKDKQSRAYLCLSNVDGHNLEHDAYKFGLMWRSFIEIDLNWIRLFLIELTRR
jgi:methylase of polypeptide subunit release factors